MNSPKLVTPELTTPFYLVSLHFQVNLLTASAARLHLALIINLSLLPCPAPSVLTSLRGQRAPTFKARKEWSSEAHRVLRRRKRQGAGAAVMESVNPVVRTTSLASRPVLRAEGARSWAHGSGAPHTLFFFPLLALYRLSGALSLRGSSVLLLRVRGSG